MPLLLELAAENIGDTRVVKELISAWMDFSQPSLLIKYTFKKKLNNMRAPVKEKNNWMLFVE